jgi:hypothetical protein
MQTLLEAIDMARHKGLSCGVCYVADRCATSANSVRRAATLARSPGRTITRTKSLA